MPASERYTSAAYRPYVMAIGQIALAWNDLHESIGVLFNSITTIATDDKVQAAFQAIDSDRLKRKMLKAAFSQLDAKEIRLNPTAVDDIKWACGQIDALEEARNNAIHSPLHMFVFSREFNLPHGVLPNDVYGNTRAAKLRNKDLLTEYRYVRDATIVLRDFIDGIEESWNWTYRRSSAPVRPQLPNRGQKNPRPTKRSDRTTQLPLPLKSQE